MGLAISGLGFMEIIRVRTRVSFVDLGEIGEEKRGKKYLMGKLICYI